MLISDDSFHNMEQTNKAVKYYNSFDYNKFKISIRKYSDVQKNVDDLHIYYHGRAKQYVNRNPEKIKKDDYGRLCVELAENSIRNHQICVRQDSIKCKLQLNANGNVGLPSECEYTTSDKLALGNILNDSLYNIITKHNQTCCYLCDECFNEIFNTKMELFRGNTPFERELNKLIFDMRNKNIQFIWKVRKLAKKEYPHLPISEIISKTPLYSFEEFTKIAGISTSRTHTPKLIKRYADSYKSQFPDATMNDLRQLGTFKYLYRFLTDILSDTEEGLLYPVLSSSQLLESDLFKELFLLEQDYLKHEYLGEQGNPPKIDVCETMTDSVYREKKYN